MTFIKAVPVEHTGERTWSAHDAHHPPISCPSVFFGLPEFSALINHRTDFVNFYSLKSDNEPENTGRAIQDERSRFIKRGQVLL